MTDRWLWLIVGVLAVGVVLLLTACKPGGYTSQGIVSGYYAGQGLQPVQQPATTGQTVNVMMNGRLVTCTKWALSWHCY